MCGIAGLFAGSSNLGAPEEVRRLLAGMTDTLVHRGPDGSGIWVDPHARCALGSRRLRVIDLTEAGHQPMASFDDRWMITFNGEIYNFEELRRILEQSGVRFQGHSDTEVLVNSMARWQTECLLRIDGMFALAAYDTISGELVLARDPFGEKPLYYMDCGQDVLAFASELTALETLP
ncbi:MAG TPA: asparagine synthetase B, partial [Thermoanaerobaculia bacterium]